ncbi:MAG: hypothetical protein ACI9OF_002302, partial [Saprospiraceae bacterium]
MCGALILALIAAIYADDCMCYVNMMLDRSIFKASDLSGATICLKSGHFRSHVNCRLASWRV